MKAAAAQTRKKPRLSKDELAYRPEESADESEQGGEGIHLEGRQGRGKRGERGEGYLGMGIAFQRGKSKRRNGTGSGPVDYGAAEVEHDEDDEGDDDQLDDGSYRHRGYTPQISVHEQEPARSPTPLRLLRALSPRKSPLPSHVPRTPRRQPPRARALLSSILDSILTSLLSIVDGIRRTLGKGRWLRWLCTGFAILLALRLLEPLVGSLISKHPSEPPGSFDEFAGRLTTLEHSVAKIDTRLDRSESDIKSLRNDLGGRIQAIERELVGVRTRIGGVEEGVKNAIDDGRLRAVLDKILPDRMPIRYFNGGIDIDPQFWIDLKKTFAGHEEVDNVVREAVTNAGVGHGNVPDLAAFEERLAQRFGRDQRETANKAWFISTLERELSTLRTAFDDKLRLAKALNATPKTKAGVAPSADLVPFLQDLVDAALLRYSKDTIARADYALHSAGARVIPSITSDTYTVRQPSAFGRWVLGRRPVEGHPPAMALHPERSVGSCWPFQGANGQLGILLANRAHVQAVSIEHAPVELVASVASAPKTVEVVSSHRGIRVWAPADESSGDLSRARKIEKRPRFTARPSELMGIFHSTLIQQTTERYIPPSFRRLLTPHLFLIRRNVIYPDPDIPRRSLCD